nr:hypothetical protein [uncultured Sphingomonas sp.]
MFRPLLLTICLAATMPAVAGVNGGQAESRQNDRQQTGTGADNQTLPGRTADTSIGQVGQRQTRGEAARGIAPAGRISNRIQNRVQSRIRNRIDRTYDPRSNANSPFAIAEEQTRTPSGRKP